MPIADFSAALPLGTYRHYKGRDYQVFGTARHSETEEMMVIYAPLYETPEKTHEKTLWVRPLSMFLETVETKDGPVARFRPL